MQFMIIDDSTTMRRIVGIALRSGGYKYVEAENGKDALDKLDKMSEKIDLFVVDVDMPLMNGIEFVGNLRKRPDYKTQPVVILTTQSDEALQQSARDAGANAWIIKPFEKGEFLALIKSLL